MGPVLFVRFRGNGKHIVIDCSDNLGRLWNVETGVSIVADLRGHTKALWSASFSLCGRYIVTGSCDRTVRVWDFESQLGEAHDRLCIAILERHTDSVISAHFSPNGKYVVSGSADKTIRMWDWRFGECIGVFNGHQATVSSGGKYILSSADDNTVRVWDSLVGLL